MSSDTNETYEAAVVTACDLLQVIPGVLKLSSRNFKTCSTRGYVMKVFHPAFGYLPKFMVKTNRIKERMDQYVVVNIVRDDSPSNIQIYGTINRYIGKVGDQSAEKELCKIMGTCYWSRKIDRTDPLKIGISEIDLTPQRLDLTDQDLTIISVDPKGSRDIDDALSIVKNSDTNHTVGVHIADPSSYLIEGSELDLEVAKRSESVYLSDTTFHMFPEALSTETFSLLESKDSETKGSRAFSVFFEIQRSDDSKHTITKSWITKTLINVTKNMSYQEFETRYSEDSDTKALYEIGASLARDSENYDSKKMIETFMVLANVTVAETMIRKGKGSDLEPLMILRSQGDSGSNDQGTNDPNLPDDLRAKHHQLKMNRAKLKIYSGDESDRHHALNLPLYTQFTSPIRRYSDLLVHRILWNLLEPPVDQRFKLTEFQKMTREQIETMNHFKSYYRRIQDLEQDIQITHKVTSTFGSDPMNRILEAKGIILDIEIMDSIGLKKICDNEKVILLKVECQEVPIEQHDPDFKDTKIIQEVSQYFKHTIHTIRIRVDGSDMHNVRTMFTLFEPIQFKLCFLNRDVRKIRAYI